MEFRKIEYGHRVMKIDSELTEATVIERKNRFLVEVESSGRTLNVHLHDPGRLKELIFPGSKVNIRKSKGEKTSFSITSVIHNGEEILIDTRFHNRIAEIFINGSFRREVTHGDSRYDFGIEDGYVEVKGCSMQLGEYVIFPDAPTSRGAKHIRNLTKMRNEGMDTNLIFLLFRRNTKYFYPNIATDPIFAEAFFKAVSSGVGMIFPRFSMKGDSIFFDGMNTIGENPFN
ncbi:MAG: sugar fermentation stimulation protein SfsA [Cuniculiplasma sp. C_DKE]|uniref:DNA-binding protein, stimulates sugar fermentation n=1 Tax=Cuniculiplasma divulgatum TaxID=1673428 RepID=A0A1R4A5E5_9ARCH|nr:DNA/RNA nuclease SfsA [Cuniculiplasma divulgatum]EQB69171.1 MAG: sugar fermentation stimulation protein A [Thermoplasmatales archaeon Gpl]MCI2413517.1 DNA/RNA nuclease SfsA [Cuniculiplasma sp.]OWP54931.1 MAG: sugar fermentation stimulation protein SfsA [Cuniculiplasma sp. C_DKE]SJK84182.1 DNA-binding protein, stimulates sugar fermentation [Cuniculiplasma divulgatum]